MTIRPQTLWRVPVFCAVASAVSFYLTVYLGRFFIVVETPGPDGTPVLSADPLRSALLNGALFVLVLLAGGLLVFRSMTRREIAASAALFAGIDLVLCLLQLLAPDLLSPLLVPVALIQNWTAVPTSALYHLTGHLPVSALAACLGAVSFCSLRKTVRIRII